MPRAGKSDRARDRSRLEAKLDEALGETFPASDPIAVGRPTATERPRRRGKRPRASSDAADNSRRPEPGAGRAKGHGAKVRGP